uniref:Transposase n=1 Tax=Strongyloides venezuelensis TaxID=75913 RepID=A0A0K0FIU6_STRVS
MNISKDSKRITMVLHATTEYINYLAKQGIRKPKNNVIEKFAKTLSLIKSLPKFFRHYPINAARNIARISKRTRLFLSGDIENYSSSNYESKVSKLAEKVILNNNESNLVLVHRRFEILKTVPVPKLKTELYELFKNIQAYVFHWFFFKKGHDIAGLNDWFNSKENLNETTWEPQFVGDDRVSFHDETFPYTVCSNRT